MDDRFPRLRQTLSTREGFERVISFPNQWSKVIVACCLLGGPMWFMFFLLVFVAIGKGGMSLGAFFPELFTEHGAVWGVWIVSAVMLALALVAVARKRITRRSTIDKAFRDYQVRGRIANTYFAEVNVYSPFGYHKLMLYTPTDVSEEDIEGVRSFFKPITRSTKKSPEAKEWAEQMRGRLLKEACGPTAIPARRIEATLPDGVWVCSQSPVSGRFGVFSARPEPFSTRLVVFIPNEAGTEATVYLFEEHISLA